MVTAVLLTSDELRHRFVRAALSAHDGLELMTTFAEPHALGASASSTARSEPEQRHLLARARSEEDFFGPTVELCRVRSELRPIRRGELNEDHIVRAIVDLRPDVIAAFGCSIIGPALIEAFPRRLINLHLGLSPYYRGSGTNFWPLVNGEPELVGATFLHVDEGIDTGEIIHQLRARVVPGDSAHQIGNRLIADAGRAFPRVLCAAPDLEAVPPAADATGGRCYRRADVDGAAVRRLEERFAQGMVAQHLEERARRIAATPIVEHPAIDPLSDPPTAP